MVRKTANRAVRTRVHPESSCNRDGDVASTLFSLYIALHTALALTMDLVCAWIFVVILTAIGPLAIYVSAVGPYWGAAGNRCWLTTNYDKSVCTSVIYGESTPTI